MKYLCLVYYDEQIMKSMSQSEWDALNNECLGCVAGFSESGHFLDGAPLYITDTASTLRVRDGRVQTMDGPFAETKEQLAGFYMLDARDKAEALQLAAKIPPARFGCVEVRPVRDLLTEGNVL